MLQIREAKDTDVEQVRDLFVQVYGEDYPFTDFYDTSWLKKSVYDENTLFLVMEDNGKIIATASMMLAAGGFDDMIGEAGRLVAIPDSRYRGKNLYTELIEALVKRTENRVQFLMAEARTAHRGSQRIAENVGWKAIGFEPMKYLLGSKRESAIFYGNCHQLSLTLRRNNPRVIPEIAPLAQMALENMALPVDIIVEDEVDGYPMGQSFTIELLKDQQGLTSLLRIERGRVSNVEVFGNFSLSYGFHRIDNSNTHYIVASEGNVVLGAVGFSYDSIDKKVRIFELIEFDEEVEGFLLASVDRIVREEL
ncbi:GNAT family N-acetyltransferase, partial [candidate division CSSED10-310 bacterium]